MTDCWSCCQANEQNVNHEGWTNKPTEKHTLIYSQEPATKGNEQGAKNNTLLY